jgi:hypothetical protein
MQPNHIILLQNYAVMHTILQSKEERLTEIMGESMLLQHNVQKLDLIKGT